jgi:hypothetical protein
MARSRCAVRSPVAATAAACGPDEPARLPWWPATPAAAARSPLLDAVGLAPPRLDGPGVHG